MDAEQRIIKLLKDKKESGILQSEIPSLLNISKSTVSETISKLEEDGIVVRKKVTSKSYRVWLAEHSPEPVEGLIRVEEAGGIVVAVLAVVDREESEMVNLRSLIKLSELLEAKDRG